MSLDNSKLEKKKWECPNLQILLTKETSSGTPERTPEEMSYNPVIS
jgi:hypothetical protein